MKIPVGLINMISTRRKLFMIALVVIVSLWGAILGLTSSEVPFSCAWPDLDELITGKAELPTSSVNIDLRLPGMTKLEEAIAVAIIKTKFFAIRFEPERDFVGHALPGSLRVWRYDGERWTSVEESAAMTEVQRPWEMSEFMSGVYPAQMFRFAVTQITAKHACVIVEAEARMGRSYEFLHAFRPRFGPGAWRVVSKGGGGFSY